MAVHRNVIGTRGYFALLGLFYGLLCQSLLEGMLHYPKFLVSIIVLAAMLYHFRPNEESNSAGGNPDGSWERLSCQTD